jgi:hypothetical protein
MNLNKQHGLKEHMIKSLLHSARPKFWSWLIVALFLSAVSKCALAQTTFVDLQFGRYQIADSQWNVSACTGTTTCQIYATNPGTMYKIPWTTGQWSWQTGQYVKFEASGDANYPWTAKVYNSDGTVAGVIGTGKVINMGTDANGKSFFFFMGSDNDTGQLFSTNTGLTGTGGYTWTGTLNPTTTQLNTFASTGSTTPLASGQTYTSAPTPTPTPIYNNNVTAGAAIYITNHYPTSDNSPAGEGAANAFDNNPNTKYLNFDKYNAGVTVKLNSGRAVTAFKLTTANDFPGRDPTSYKLYGSNDGVNWTLIQQGSLSLSNTRFWTSPEIPVTNATAYAYYYIFFPTTKAGDGCGLDCNSMQIAEITYIYDSSSTTTSTASGSTVSNPGSLCCGGSSAPFSADATNTAKVNAFLGRTTNDSKVRIEQIGNYNTITVQQTGTRQNYTEYYGNGSGNTVNVTQSGTANTQVNYTDLRVLGSNNTVNITQQSTGGGKGVFATVNDNNNSLTIQQRDSGSHYAEVTLSGGNKNVDITQQGSASHMARVNLSGLAQELSLTQSGSTQQFYSITSNCATAGGCARITVNQGQ